MTIETANKPAEAAPAADPRDARIAELEAERSKLQAESKAHRQGKAAAKAEAESKAQAALLAEGKFEELAKAKAAEVEELRTKLSEAEPRLAAWQADEEARKAALEAQIAELPEEDRNLVNAGSSLAAKEALARRFLGSPTAPVVQGSSNAAAPTKTPAPNTSDLRSLAELKRTDQDAYVAALASKTSAVPGFAGRLWGTKKTP